jgi:hypothetical protein
MKRSLGVEPFITTPSVEMPAARRRLDRYPRPSSAKPQPVWVIDDSLTFDRQSVVRFNHEPPTDEGATL